MIEEIKTFRLTCNDCKESIIIQDSHIIIPDDWIVETQSVGFSKFVRHFCPECKSKNKRV